MTFARIFLVTFLVTSSVFASNSEEKEVFGVSNLLNSGDFVEKLNNVNQQKSQEQKNNEIFYKATTCNSLELKRQEWKDFITNSCQHIEKIPTFCEKRKVKIGEVEFEAYDLSKSDYSFLIHTIDFIPEKKEKLHNYLTNQVNDLSTTQTFPSINFDVCPLISGSIINPITGGYTDNCDFNARGLPVE